MPYSPKGTSTTPPKRANVCSRIVSFAQLGTLLLARYAARNQTRDLALEPLTLKKRELVSQIGVVSKTHPSQIALVFHTRGTHESKNGTQSEDPVTAR